MNQYPDNVLTIPHATDSKIDSAQYMYRVYKGRKVINFNLCGEFCVAFCMQDEAHTDNVDEFLDYWQATSLKWYNSAFQNGLGRRTGKADLKEMLDDYSAFYTDMTRLKIEETAMTLNEYQLIIGVQIDYSGYLVNNGIPHWVVLDKLSLGAGNTAAVEVYNPFVNAIQPYGWREFNNSTGTSKYGLWVRRITL